MERNLREGEMLAKYLSLVTLVPAKKLTRKDAQTVELLQRN